VAEPSPPEAPARPLFMVIPSAGGAEGYTLVAPFFVVTGFASQEDAHGWILHFFDTNARRAADLEEEAKMDKERLAMEREEMLMRSLEPKAVQ